MKLSRNSFRLLAIIMAVVGLHAVALAQDASPIEPLALTGEPVILNFSVGASGPPTIEPLTDGRMTFRISAAGDVSGALDGNLSARVSEVTEMPSPPSHPVSVMFTIETAQGDLEGYYAGNIHLPTGAEQASVIAFGRILSVSGAFADLYLADVFVSSTVQFVDGRSTGETGTITIAAR